MNELLLDKAAGQHTFNEAPDPDSKAQNTAILKHTYLSYLKPPLKVLSNENRGGSTRKLVSIDPF